MAEWITSKSGNITNLDALVQVVIRKVGEEYRVVGVLGTSVSEGASEKNEICLFSGTQKDCDAALFSIHRRLKPLNLG